MDLRETTKGSENLGTTPNEVYFRFVYTIPNKFFVDAEDLYEICANICSCPIILAV